MSEPSSTPMMRQYMSIKAHYKSEILMYRLGDFYEMFADDAIKASAILGITLTARGKGTPNEVPMCGIPFHAFDSYIPKLTAKGLSVAVCEQVSDASLPGIVQREVVRVITPGTVLSESMLDPKSNNFVASLFKVDDVFSVAFCDISTGMLLVTEGSKAQILEEVLKYGPSEVVAQNSFDSIVEFAVKEFETPLEDRRIVFEHFESFALQSFGVASNQVAIGALNLLLSYLKHTQKRALVNISTIKFYVVSDGLQLDESTVRNLELVKTMRDGSVKESLFGVIDRTITPMGARLLKSAILKPLSDSNMIDERLDAVENFKNDVFKVADLQQVLKRIMDIERLFSKIALNSCSPRDLGALLSSIQEALLIRSKVANSGIKILETIFSETPDLSGFTNNLQSVLQDELPISVADGGVIKSGVIPELDELRGLQGTAKTLILEIGEREKIRTGINSLKVKFNSVFGYYIEVSSNNLHLVPQDYIRKQTLANAERFITPELKELEEKILNSEGKILEIEKRIFEELRMKITNRGAEILRLANCVAQVDFLVGLGSLALEKSYCRPKMTNDGTLQIKDGRHPVIETLLKEGDFVPNDAELSSDKEYIKLITGPNMAGKSTYLRQVAIISLMAHIGSFVPAKSAAIPIMDRIFTRVGASDNLAKGQSTFMVEMQEASFILANATENSLIILDEIGRGTSTYDGVSIAWSMLEYIHNTIKAKTLFATHYHELIDVAEELPNACNWSVQVAEIGDQEKSIIFLHKVVEGAVNRSYGIEVAKLAGLPREVTKRASKILERLERDHTGIGKPLMQKQSIQQNLFNE